MYKDSVRKLFDSPRNAGVFDESKNVVVGRAGDRSAGATVEFSLAIDGQVIKDAKFRAYGCPHTIAAASYVAANLVGAEVDALAGFDPHRMTEALDFPAEKLGRALIIEDALRRCRELLAAKGAGHQ